MRFLVRLAFTSLALLGLAKMFSVDLVEHLLPAFRAEVAALGDNISILGLEIIQDGPSNAIRMRANLLHPIYIKQYAVYPLGWQPETEGWYQVYLNARSVLQGSLILVIVILSWPHRTLGELAARLLIALPLNVFLIAIDAPLELLGNFQHAVLHDVDPQGFLALFAWDKFLEGGGNCVLALAFSAFAIVLAVRLPSFAAALRSRQSPISETAEGISLGRIQ